MNFSKPAIDNMSDGGSGLARVEGYNKVKGAFLRLKPIDFESKIPLEVFCIRPVG